MGAGQTNCVTKAQIILGNFMRFFVFYLLCSTNKILLSQVLQVVGDVSKQEDMERIIKETADKFGEIHVLVNNAGFGVTSTIADVRLRIASNTMLSVI